MASRAAAKTAWQSSRLPLMRWMEGDLAAREVAEGESTLRVRAMMLISGSLGDERRLVMTALPCLPVAPVTRMFFAIMDRIPDDSTQLMCGE